MVTTGEVGLDDTVAAHLEMAKGLGDLRLVELATHTSGLPQLPDPLPACGATNPADPYSTVSLEHMAAALRGAAPGPTRGALAYSNFGFAVLALALASAAEASFQDLLRERVLRPLALDDTVFDSESEERLTAGHDLTGAPAPHWHNPVMAGCGALLSTTADLARYLAAQLRPDPTPLTEAISLTHLPRAVEAPPPTPIGLGWLIEYRHGIRRYWHNGGTYGFSAYAAFEPDNDKAVVLLLSKRPAGNQALERLGGALLDAL